MALMCLDAKNFFSLSPLWRIALSYCAHDDIARIFTYLLQIVLFLKVTTMRTAPLVSAHVAFGSTNMTRPVFPRHASWAQQGNASIHKGEMGNKSSWRPSTSTPLPIPTGKIPAGCTRLPWPVNGHGHEHYRERFEPHEPPPAR